MKLFQKKAALLNMLIALNVIFFAGAHAQENINIGVISDIHIHNIYPDKDSAALRYFYDSTKHKAVLIRTLTSEMNSTRLFNENYYALHQALTDIAKKGIKLVIIPGDYSDDGQLVNLLLVKEVLSFYEEKYQMRFLITNGNHDVNEPFEAESGKNDFLGKDGNPTGVYSSATLAKQPNDHVYPPLKVGGYNAVFNIMQSFGFSPSSKDLFYSTPYQSFNYDSYRYDTSAFSLRKRWYHYGNDSFPDLTYLAEPVKDLWVMAIDGNTFERIGKNNFENIGDGYQYLFQKNSLLTWIKKIADEAAKRGKTLIAFSHYPVLDFNNQQSPALQKIFGKDKFQLGRVPGDSIQTFFAESGIPVFFAGHLHINQHGFLKGKAQNGIWNIQVPSLAAFPPAYKIASSNKKRIIIKTQALKKVAHYNDLFDYYKHEKKDNALSIILDSSHNYYTFTKSHLLYLARNRFYNSDFSDPKWEMYKNTTSKHWVSEAFMNHLSAKEKKTFSQLTFMDVVNDLYLLRNANDFGIKEIAIERLQLYYKWAKLASSATFHKSPLDELIIIIQKLKDSSVPTLKTVIRLSAQ